MQRCREAHRTARTQQARPGQGRREASGRFTHKPKSAYAPRGEKPSFAARGDKPSFAARGEKPSFSGRGEKPSFGGLKREAALWIARRKALVRAPARAAAPAKAPPLPRRDAIVEKAAGRHRQWSRQACKTSPLRLTKPVCASTLLRGALSGLSFSHIQRIIRKGEVRLKVSVSAEGPDRRGPGHPNPAAHDRGPRPETRLSADDQKTRDFLKSHHAARGRRRAGVQQPYGLSVQAAPAPRATSTACWSAARSRPRRQKPRLVHRLDKDTAGCLLVAKTRFAAAALAKTFRSRSARKIYWALTAGAEAASGSHLDLPRQGGARGGVVHAHRPARRGGGEPRRHLLRVVETAGSGLAWVRSSPSPDARISSAPIWRMSAIRSSAIRNTSRSRTGSCPAHANRLHLLASARIAVPATQRGMGRSGAVSADRPCSSLECRPITRYAAREQMQAVLHAAGQLPVLDLEVFSDRRRSDCRHAPYGRGADACVR